MISIKEKVSKNNYKTIDLFAGIGGIRLAFEKNGFETVFANDFDLYCKSTYDKNFKSAKLTVADIKDIKISELPQFDFLIGGFPCQPFSVAGYRKGFDDDKGRGDLFFHIARILEYHRPMGFMLENVKHLETHDNGNTFRIIKETLEGLGYYVKHQILNGMEHGNLPQNRERIYIVGFIDKDVADRFEFPERTPLTKTIMDVLLPDDEIDDIYYYNGKSLFEKIKADVVEKGVVYQWRRHYVRKNKSGVCPTLTANMGTGGHNVPIIIDDRGIRKLSPRECLRLQGFDDNYILGDISQARMYKQIGNSVNVTVVERIAENISLALGNTIQISLEPEAILSNNVIRSEEQSIA